LSLKLGTADFAKYPFLNEASKFLTESHLDVDEFNRPEMEYIIDRAAIRVEVEMQGKIYKNLERHEVEVLTFLSALILVKLTNIEQILKKHSLFEAMRAEAFLIQDLRTERDEKKKQLLLFEIFKELFKVEVDLDPENAQVFRMKVTDYLVRSSHFHEEGWKIVNKAVHGGYVYLDADEIVRLVRNELGNLIYEKIRAMSLSNVPQPIVQKANYLALKFRPTYENKLPRISDYPPCIKHALDLMSKGENLPHTARLMVATYMLSIGKNIDSIVTLFHPAPDFNEKITRYQVEHLAGLKGGQTRYNVPSCSKLNSEDLCFRTLDCGEITNPLKFRRRPD
jgi:DNA primase large subunit